MLSEFSHVLFHITNSAPLAHHHRREKNNQKDEKKKNNQKIKKIKKDLTCVLSCRQSVTWADRRSSDPAFRGFKKKR
jgi:hypothetical protein